MEELVEKLITMINSNSAEELVKIDSLQRDFGLNNLKNILDKVYNGEITDPKVVQDLIDKFLKEQIWLTAKAKHTNEITLWNKLRLMLSNAQRTGTIDGEIEMLINSRIENEKIQYLVKWRNLDKHYNSWVDEKEIELSLIQEYNLITELRN